MTKILVEREVLERVLEALALAERTSYSETNQDKFIAAADKLRALLDTPSEPNKYTDIISDGGFDPRGETMTAELEMMNEENGRLRREIATWKAVHEVNADTLNAMQAEIEQLHKANMELGLENGDLQDEMRKINHIFELRQKAPPVAYYDISHDEYGDVEYEFSVYPRNGFEPLYTNPKGQP